MGNHKKKYFMRLALQQARTIIGNTAKNPAVGCVIVNKGCVVSVASTSKKGRPHAEHNALNNLKTKLKKNAQLFVTLEPCSHHGKTKPCVRKIINSKIKKVYFSVNDPDPRSYNKCKNILKKKSIHSFDGINSKEIKIFYKSYFKYKKYKTFCFI